MYSLLVFGCLLLLGGAQAHCGKPEGVKANLFDCYSGMKTISKEIKDKCNIPDGPPMGPPMGPPNGPPQGGPKGPPCEVVKCVLTEKKLLENDKVKRAELRDDMISMQPEYQTTIESSYEKCNSEVDVKTECEPRAFVFCMKHDIMMNAPDSAWDNSEDCTKWRDHIRKCVF